jgi:regulator of replication initiation timing
MDKIHKYAQKYCDEVKVSTLGNSYYYHFNGGKFILRISDHVGKNSDGKVSIITDQNGYLLHNHNTGAVYIETYENLKMFIKSLATLNTINVNFDLSRSEISDLRHETNVLKQQVDSLKNKNIKLGEKNTQLNNENISYKNKLKTITNDNKKIIKEITNDNKKMIEEMRRHPLRTWFKLFIEYRK